MGGIGVGYANGPKDARTHAESSVFPAGGAGVRQPPTSLSYVENTERNILAWRSTEPAPIRLCLRETAKEFVNKMRSILPFLPGGG